MFVKVKKIPNYENNKAEINYFYFGWGKKIIVFGLGKQENRKL